MFLWLVMSEEGETSTQQPHMACKKTIPWFSKEVQKVQTVSPVAGERTRVSKRSI